MRNRIVKILLLMFVLYLTISFGYCTKAATLYWPDFGARTRFSTDFYNTVFLDWYNNNSVTGYSRGTLNVGDKLNGLSTYVDNNRYDTSGFIISTSGKDIIESWFDITGSLKGRTVDNDVYSYAGISRLIKVENKDILPNTEYTVFGKYIIHGNQLLSLDKDNKVEYENIHWSNSFFAGTVNNALNESINTKIINGVSVSEAITPGYGANADLMRHFWNTWIENGLNLSNKNISKLETNTSMDDYAGSIDVTANKTWCKNIGNTRFVKADNPAQAETFDLEIDEGDEFTEEEITLKEEENKYKIGTFNFKFDGYIKDTSRVIISNTGTENKVEYTFAQLGLTSVKSEKNFSIKWDPTNTGVDVTKKLHVRFEIELSYHDGIIPGQCNIIYILKSNNASPDLVAGNFPGITYQTATTTKYFDYDIDSNNTKLKVVSWLYKELQDDGTYESKSKLKDVEFMVFYSKTEIDLDDDDTKCQYVYYDEDSGKYKLSSNKNKISKYKNFNATNLPDKSLLTTNSKGELTLTGLEPGYYYVKGLSSYNKSGEPIYCYTGKIQEVHITEGKSKSVKLVNYYNVGKLKIIKTDDDGKAWEDIEFEIAYQEEKTCSSNGSSWATCGNAYHTDCDEYYFVKEDRKSTDSYVGQGEESETLYFEEEDVVTTNSKGRITLTKLYAGKYEITEKNLPYGYVMCVYKDGKWEEIEGTSYSVEIKPGKTTTIKIKNKKKYIKIGGYVWEENSSNNLYDGTTKDKTFEGIVVQLVDNNGNVDKQTTSKSDGTYELVDVLYANLSNYYIRFIYDGFTYNTVSVDTTKANGSKGTENATDRTNLNNKFKFITGLESNNVSGTTTTVNAVSTVDKTLALKYNTVAGQNGSADIATYTNEQWIYDSSKPTIKKTERKAAEYDVSAKANIVIPTDKRATKIYNINLGLVQKEQADLKIENTLYNVIETINNHTETYNQNLNDGIYINASDIMSLYDNEFEDQWLRIYLTYKITITNESKLNMKVYEIVGNCEETEDYKLLQQDDGLYNGLNIETDKLTITASNGIELKPGESKNIYVQAELKKESIKGMLDKENNKWNAMNLLNIVEINKYSTHDSSWNLYAALDKDSAIGNKSAFSKEDDTSENKITFSSGWENARTIKGNVFEDLPESIMKDIVNTGKERVGNGIYDNDEKSVVNVLVELVPMKTNEEKAPYVTAKNGYIGESNVSYIYNSSDNEDYLCNDDIMDSDYIVGKKSVAVVWTNENGEYSFSGVLPGTYVIRFVWGDKVILDIDGVISSTFKTRTEDRKYITVQDYKSTIRVDRESNKYADSNWYTITEDKMYSDALDNYDKRKDINSYLSNISYSVKTGYENNNDYSLNADTETMNIEIGTRNVSNVDFGLIERPKQDIQVTKEISYVNLALANGNPITVGPTRDENGNISDKLSYATYLKPETEKGGILKMELDSELVHGSILEVTYKIIVENLSEIDYNDKKYYEYGVPENTDKLVKTTITQMLDYMQNDGLVYKKTDDKWRCLTNSEFIQLRKDNTIELSKDAYTKAEEFDQILLLEETDELSDIGPGKEGNVSFYASRTIASSSEDLTYNNDVEVIKIHNSVGRFMANSTPGDHVPQTNDGDIDNDNIDVAIVPPTGETRIYYVLGITSLLIIALGVVLIKKKVIG